MTILDIAKDLGLELKRVSTAQGGEYSSPCPMCGGEDRFRVWPEQGRKGSWWCRRCDKKGDDIQLLIEAKGMSFPEACAYLGRKLPEKIRRRALAPPKTKTERWAPRKITEPVGEWKTKAEAFVGWAHRHLLKNKEELKWLKTRGITEKTVRRFKLGRNPEDIYRSRSSWGLPESKNNKKRLWLPKGLVIPWSIDGEIHRLRIRRPEGDLRYYVVPGSGMAPTVIVGETKRVCVVVESELDAILIAQEAGDIVSVVALGNSSAHPDKIAKDLLSSADHIMVALDFDEAGVKAWGQWKEQYLQVTRWPVPEGKDPGEYFKAGGDIREWVIAGLPPGLKPAPLKKEVVALIEEPPAAIDETVTLVGESFENEYGFREIDRPCFCCKKPLILRVPKGHSARIPCFECAERYHGRYPRKSA